MTETYRYGVRIQGKVQHLTHRTDDDDEWRSLCGLDFGDNYVWNSPDIYDLPICAHCAKRKEREEEGAA